MTLEQLEVQRLDLIKHMEEGAAIMIALMDEINRLKLQIWLLTEGKDESFTNRNRD